MKSSTRSFVRAARQVPGFSLFDFIHGYIYACWPYFYIGTALNPPWLLRPLTRFADWLIRRREVSRHKDRGTAIAPAAPTIADTYHGKARAAG